MGYFYDGVYAETAHKTFVARNPWSDSPIDPSDSMFREPDPEDEIEKCLSCGYNECINCMEYVRSRRNSFDPDVLRELLKLRKKTTEICKIMNCSYATAVRWKKKLKEELE